jgi:hypothetical protein
MGAAVKLKMDEIFDNDTKRFGIVKGHEFFDQEGKLMGYVKDEEIYTSLHIKVAYVRSENIYNTANKKMISLSDAKTVMKCNYEGATLAGYWFFFKPARKV